MQKVFKDHLNREIRISFPPKRIVSLCPSQTETLFALGLEKQIIGRTKYCIHPTNKIKSVKVVGGTKEINFDEIKKLEPDLIIAEKEENTKNIVDTLSKSFPVYITKVKTYEDALNMINNLGEITNTIDKSQKIILKIKQNFSKIKPLNCKIAYIIWKNPYMSIGKDTFISSMLEKCGFENVFKDYSRYPVIENKDIQIRLPKIIFLPSEPYPFAKIHIKEFQFILPSAKIMLVDGEMFSWYGSHMLQAPSYFNKIIQIIRTI